jgi:hypothetical protein
MTTPHDLAAWGALFERYPCIRLIDAAALLSTPLAGGERSQQRAARMCTDAGVAHRVLVLGVQALVSTASARVHPVTLAHSLQRAMLDAALMQDGYTIAVDGHAHQALRSWLLQQPPAPGVDPRFAKVARERSHLLPEDGPPLPYTVAWKGPASAPQDLRLSVVIHPRRSLKSQLEELPLRTLGQPQIPVILRPADDGTAVSRITGELSYTGPKYRALMLAFRAHRNPGAFPYWETAVVLNYRPDLWVRTWSQ